MGSMNVLLIGLREFFFFFFFKILGNGQQLTFKRAL